MKRRRLHPEDYTVGWVCSLPIELAAATIVLDEEHEDFPQDKSDGNLYTLGRISGHNIVIACLPAGQTGTNSAASVANRMNSKFSSIRFGLLVGVGGGVPSAEPNIRLGDVVVSQPFSDHGGVVQYDFGKTTPSGFKRTGSLNTPPMTLLQALTKLQANHHRSISSLTRYLSIFSNIPKFARNNTGPDILFESSYNHIGGHTCERCSKDRLLVRTTRDGEEIMVHYGTIASGNQVVRDGLQRDRLSSELGNILCFEMEAAGLMNSFPCLVIRGICDYADSHKNKKWQPYAAATAAAYAKEILSVIPATEVATTRVVDEAAMHEMLRSAIDDINLDQFLPMLSVLDQDEHISAIPHPDRDHPMFYWIFRNKDFLQWSSAECSQVLWLSGLPERNIDQVSSYVVHQEKETALKTDRFVLYYFSLPTIRRKLSVADFIYTLLKQIVYCSPMDKRILIIRNFLHSLLEQVVKREAGPNLKRWSLCKECYPDEYIEGILNAPVDELFTALCAVLGSQEQRGLSLIVDGLDRVEHKRDEYIKEVRAFIEYLQQRASEVKILLTSQPLAEIRELFDGLPCIKYDRERKDCLASLRFNNTRYNKISPQYKGSFEWIWEHDKYKNWCTPNASRLLYIQGKPGSGKSTITKYFSNHLLEQERVAKSAIIAKFFYSYREGELQRSHYSMFQSILYDILHEDEAFFYHRFQTEYRAQCRDGYLVTWDYASLKTILKSLQDHSPAKPLYLIIDAVDESENNDRRDVLDLLFKLCSETKYCTVKIFIASRPLGQLELRRSQFHNFIRLQDNTEADISSFALSFLNRLSLTRRLVQAREYIVENAQGVFLWVELVGKELMACEESGYSEEDIIEFLKCLPKELETFYELMLERITMRKSNLRNLRNLQDLRNHRDLQDGIKMFRLVLWARRPLTVDELLHALGIPDNPDARFIPDDSFQIPIPPERRIISCGGNFLVIKSYHGNGTVQVMHQTVREFFLDPNGLVASSEFRMCEKDAHVCISVTCLRYLMLCAANTTLAGRPPDIEFWTREHFKDYAQYLDDMPLANYALGHLKHHIDGYQQDANIQRMTSQFIAGLTDNPAVYWLGSWVSSQLKKILTNYEPGAAKGFRDRILHAAVRKGFSTAAEVLLTAGADVNAGDVVGWTALHLAAKEGHTPVARLLVEKGADIHVKIMCGYTALHLVAEEGHEPVARLLVEKGADIHAKNTYGHTALHLAAEGGHEAVIRLLVEKGADIHAKNIYGHTALYLVAEGGHEAVARLLVEKGADIYAKNIYGYTALHLAAEGGHEAVVRLLAEKGVNIYEKNIRGHTALHLAAEGGHEAVIRLLVEKGADIHAKNIYGHTALYLVAEGGHEAAARLLVEKGADIYAKNIYGHTALHLAAEGGHEAVVRLLVEKGADIYEKNMHGHTALHLAAERGYEAVARLLVEKGANIYAKNIYGHTALHLAAERGHEAVVRQLIEKRADIYVKNCADAWRYI